MKIVLVGYGKMGRMIEGIALQKGHTIAKIHPSGLLSSINETSVSDADICIDFSVPETAVSNIRTLASFKKNIVVGTTGWYEHLDEVKKIVEQNQIGFMYSPNFSLGMYLFKSILENAADLINGFEDYDIAGHEMHHHQKVDSPSGTAKSIINSLLERIKRKTSPVYDSMDRPIAPHELHFPSIRCGFIQGIHSVIFDSPADTITITHQVRNREGFARGALTAAEWLIDKQGFFTLDDMIRSTL